MSMVNTLSNMALLSEEDAATIPPEDVARLVREGRISPTQPGLRFATPTTKTPDQVKLPDAVTTETTGGTTTTTTTTTRDTFTPRSDARNTIAAVLNRFGLGSLSGFLYDLYAKQEVDLNNPDALIFALRDRPEFQARFSANARRATKNLPELDPGSYLELENTYRSLLRSNGLPAQFYDSNEDFADLIAGDVSPAELQARIQNGYRKVAEADPEVKRQMRQLYNVDDAGLAAYFLDPERAAPILEAQARSAQIAARAREQGGIQIGRMTAEELVSRGYTEQEAQQAFQRLNLLSGLYTEMAGEEQLTEAQKVGAAFGYDVQAAEELALRQRRRVAEFQTGGQFARTSGATSGTVETGLGGPQ